MKKKKKERKKERKKAIEVDVGTIEAVDKALGEWDHTVHIQIDCHLLMLCVGRNKEAAES